MRRYLESGLAEVYAEREASNIVVELFRHFHGFNRADLIANASGAMSESEMLKYHFALKRLKTGEPLQYVLGSAWFAGMLFHVDKSVLIPRPETEELVHLIVSQNPSFSGALLDIGSGSGCIPIALKKLLPESSIHSCDVSAEALQIARKNADNLSMEVHFFACDILNSTPDIQVDIIVSNPPYIPEEEAEEMHAGVTDFEPALALFVPNSDPLLFYRRILDFSKKHLNPGGRVYFELHERFAEAFKTLAQDFGYSHCSIFPDLQGKQRMAVVSR